MSEYSGFIFVNINTLGPFIFSGSHMMSDCTSSTVLSIITKSSTREEVYNSSEQHLKD